MGQPLRHPQLLPSQGLRYFLLAFFAALGALGVAAGIHTAVQEISFYQRMQTRGVTTTAVFRVIEYTNRATPGRTKRRGMGSPVAVFDIRDQEGAPRELRAKLDGFLKAETQPVTYDSSDPTVYRLSSQASVAALCFQLGLAGVFVLIGLLGVFFLARKLKRLQHLASIGEATNAEIVEVCWSLFSAKNSHRVNAFTRRSKSLPHYYLKLRWRVAGESHWRFCTSPPVSYHEPSTDELHQLRPQVYYLPNNPEVWCLDPRLRLALEKR